MQNLPENDVVPSPLLAAYTRGFYDLLNSEVDFEKWAEYIEKQCLIHGRKPIKEMLVKEKPILERKEKAQSATGLKWRKYLLPITRIAIAVLGVVLVIIGIFNGGMADVLEKAINICTQCIGLG